MAIAPLPADAVARFRVDLDALIGAAGPIGIAVSGGPDSLALLLLAHAARPDGVRAATVDHRLRAESATEAAFVAGLCAELGIPHETLVDAAPIAGNVQSAARALRYRLLGEWARRQGIAWLLTAHHEDDQAETLMMRLLRGAGVSGLAGIRATARIENLDVARPLLGWSRAELGEIVAEAGLAAVQDPSNADPRYDRARLRRRLAEAAWIKAPALARSAAALAETEEALAWVEERLHAERVRRNGPAIDFDAADLPAELRRRLVLRIIAALAPEAVPRGGDMQRLLDALAAGKAATLAGVKATGGAVWRFTPAPPRRR